MANHWTWNWNQMMVLNCLNLVDFICRNRKNYQIPSHNYVAQVNFVENLAIVPRKYHFYIEKWILVDYHWNWYCHQSENLEYCSCILNLNLLKSKNYWSTTYPVSFCVMEVPFWLSQCLLFVLVNFIIKTKK